MPSPSRRQLLGIAVFAAAGTLAGCGPQPGPGPSTPTPTPSRSGSPTPAPTLLTPGAAARIVKELHGAAGNDPVIQVTITATRATVSVVRSEHALTWAWSEGTIAPADSDIQYVKQASFDPAAFNLSDVAALFAEAYRISGSDSQQQLQIVEYNQGQVLMSVATNPESATVFFRSDGTAVHALDFGVEAGITEALRDATGSSVIAVAVGCDPEQGLWVETQSDQGGVVQRRTRPPKLPAWTAARKESAADWPPFPLTDVSPALIAKLTQRLPGLLGKPDSTSVSWRLDRRDELAKPLIRFTAGGTTAVYNLAGVDVTALVNP